MTLAELRAAFRARTGDLKSPFLWSDEEIDSGFNEAQDEACIRSRLIRESGTAPTTVTTAVGVTEYALNPRILDVLSIAQDGEAFSGWDLYGNTLILSEAPTAVSELALTAVCLPTAPMGDDDDEPEIALRHHPRLIDWVMHRAYLKADSEVLNPDASQKHEAMFIRSFGERPDANVQRKRIRKSPRVVKMHF